jgi:hypothetical protein
MRQSKPTFDIVDKTMGGLVSLADIEQIGTRLTNNSSTALIIFEHAWAAALEQATVEPRAGSLCMTGSRVSSPQLPWLTLTPPWSRQRAATGNGVQAMATSAGTGFAASNARHRHRVRRGGN